MQLQLKTKSYLKMIHKMALWANKNIHWAFINEVCFTFLSSFLYPLLIYCSLIPCIICLLKILAFGNNIPNFHDSHLLFM